MYIFFEKQAEYKYFFVILNLFLQYKTKAQIRSGIWRRDPAAAENKMFFVQLASLEHHIERTNLI